jgi:predicted ester cyclase
MGIPPAGRRAEITAININRFKDGKVVESWGILDTLGLMQQLGVISTS